MSSDGDEKVENSPETAGADAPASAKDAGAAPESAAPPTSKKRRPPKSTVPTSFARRIPDELFGEISSGTPKSLLDHLAADQFDIHLREDSVIAYWGGVALVVMARHSKGELMAMLPRKIVSKLEFPKQDYLKGTSACFRMDDEWLGTFTAKLEDLKQVAERADGREGPLEFRFMTSNPGSSGLLPFDRQVQFPGSRAKLDIAAVEREGEQRFMMVDLRTGSGSDIATAHEALEQFHAGITDGKGGLSEQVAEQYAAMFAQRRELGLEALPDGTVRAGMPVAALIGLSQMRADSAVKSKLFDNARRTRVPIYVCEFMGSDARVPNQRHWTKLGAEEEKPAAFFG